jgi:hypothetical protein
MKSLPSLSLKNKMGKIRGKRGHYSEENRPGKKTERWLPEKNWKLKKAKPVMI